MTQRKDGLAGYDNDQQRAIGAESGQPMYEKGSAMERGTAHEFSSEQQSEVGSKDLKGSDPAPGSTQSKPARPVHTRLGPESRKRG
jgi:hypothetical protein